MKSNLVLLLLLLSLSLLSISYQNSIECDGNIIEQCTKCDTGENSNKCSICEDGTFPFFHNYYAFLATTLNMAYQDVEKNAI